MWFSKTVLSGCAKKRSKTASVWLVFLGGTVSNNMEVCISKPKQVPTAAWASRMLRHWIPAKDCSNVYHPFIITEETLWRIFKRDACEFSAAHKTPTILRAFPVPPIRKHLYTLVNLFSKQKASEKLEQISSDQTSCQHISCERYGGLWWKVSVSLKSLEGSELRKSWGPRTKVIW